MPYRYVEPDIFLERKDVAVFHAYRDGSDEPWDYWFTTDPDTADHSSGHGQGSWFDARRLTGMWGETPNMAQWEDWWKPRFKRENEAIVALIEEAIDDGRLPIKPTSTRSVGDSPVG